MSAPFLFEVMFVVIIAMFEDVIPAMFMNEREEVIITSSLSFIGRKPLSVYLA